MISCHSHSGEFCKHASGKLIETIERATSLGFTTYCLTEHMPRYVDSHLYPEEVELKLTPTDLITQFDSYISTARIIQKQSKINILVGMETEWITEEALPQIQKLKERYNLDFIVGSIHHIKQHPIDFSLEKFNIMQENLKLTTLEIFNLYYDEQFMMLQQLKPEVIGHFDLIRIYKDGWDSLISGKIQRNLEFVQSYSGLVELNSRAFKKGIMNDSKHMINCFLLMVKVGVKVCFSDDSHGFESVGSFYHELVEFCVLVGVKEYYCPVLSNGVFGSTKMDMKALRSKLENVKLERIDKDEWESKLCKIKSGLDQKKAELGI
jgi:histidinol-phosphatase (PHP family)